MTDTIKCTLDNAFLETCAPIYFLSIFHMDAICFSSHSSYFSFDQCPVPLFFSHTKQITKNRSKSHPHIYFNLIVQYFTLTDTGQKLWPTSTLHCCWRLSKKTNKQTNKQKTKTRNKNCMSPECELIWKFCIAIFSSFIMRLRLVFDFTIVKLLYRLKFV